MSEEDTASMQDLYETAQKKVDHYERQENGVCVAGASEDELQSSSRMILELRESLKKEKQEKQQLSDSLQGAHVELKVSIHYIAKCMIYRSMRGKRRSSHDQGYQNGRMHADYFKI